MTLKEFCDQRECFIELDTDINSGEWLASFTKWWGECSTHLDIKSGRGDSPEAALADLRQIVGVEG